MSSKLTNEEICTALLTHGTIKEAAAVLKVSDRTVYTRMAESDFKQMYEHAQADIFNGVVRVCQNRMIEAIECVADIMNDKEVNPQTRLQAAQTLLKNTVSMYEMKERVRSRAESEPLFDFNIPSQTIVHEIP